MTARLGLRTRRARETREDRSTLMSTTVIRTQRTECVCLTQKDSFHNVYPHRWTCGLSSTMVEFEIGIVIKICFEEEKP